MLALESRYAEALATASNARVSWIRCAWRRARTATWTRYVSGDYDGAIAHCRHTLEMDPEFVNAHRVLAAALLQAGRGDEAVRAAGARADLRRLASGAAVVAGARQGRDGLPDAGAVALIARARSFERTRYVPPFHLALAYTGLGALDEAFAALDQAWLDRDPALATLDAEPRFEPLRGDARYRALIDRIKIPRSLARSW